MYMYEIVFAASNDITASCGNVSNIHVRIYTYIAYS